MYRLIRQLDARAVRGGMQRCYLYSKKIVWLCSDHQKFSRGFLADDDLDTEEVTLNVDESDIINPSNFNDNNIISEDSARTVEDSTQLPSIEPAVTEVNIFHFFFIQITPVFSLQLVLTSSNAGSEQGTKISSGTSSLLQRTRSKACTVM